MPALGGNGLAMRMGVFLEAYARRFDVTLVIVPLTGQAADDAPSSFIQRHAERVIALPLDRCLHPLFQLIARHRDPTARRAAMRAYPRPRLFFYDPIVARELLAGHLGSQHFALVHAGRSYTWRRWWRPISAKRAACSIWTRMTGTRCGSIGGAAVGQRRPGSRR